MSIQAVSWAIEQEDVPPGPALVLISIANHADHTSGYCWLKMETIAREARCTPRSVHNHIGALVRNGYIRKATRKGDDGKQRANDYWLMFARDPAEWDWHAHVEPAEGDGDGNEIAPSESETQDVVSPHEIDSVGPGEMDSSGKPMDMSQDSVGPHETRFSRYNAEPSKTKPLEGSAFAAPPRSYRPPPQPVDEPQGAIGDLKAATVFVYEGTRAWEAWLKEKRRATGNPTWRLTTTQVVEGKSRSGWYFPTLFPPEPKSETKTTGPPTSPAMTADDTRFLETEGLRIK